MNALGMVLKAIGVNATEEHVRQIEILIPQLPARMQQAIEVINAAVSDNQQRLSAVEQRLAGIEAALASLAEIREVVFNARGASASGKRGSHATAGGNGNGRDHR